MWTPTPRPGPARVCVCVPFLAGSGGPASRARSGAPHLSFGRSWCALCLFGPLRAGVALFVVVAGFFLFFFFLPSLLRPRCLLHCVFSGPGCLGSWRLVVLPPFFCFGFAPPWSPAFPVFGPGVPWASAPCRAPPPPLFFSLFFLLPASCFCFVSCFLVFLSFFLSLFFFSFARVPCGAGCVSWAVWFARVCSGGAVPVVALYAVLSRPSGAGWCCVVLPVVFGCLLLGLTVLCCLLVGLVLSCFGGAVLVWPHGSPPCGLSWCVLVFRCPVLCSVALCCRVVVCCRALPFVCVVACACCLFPAAARLLCAFWGVVLCVPCPLRPVRCCAALCWCPCVVLSASSVLFLVPGVVGSWCRCLLLGVCWLLWVPGVVVWWCVSALVPVSGLAVARHLHCVVLLPCVVSRGGVLPCGAVLWCPVVIFCFFLAGGAGFLFPP